MQACGAAFAYVRSPSSRFLNFWGQKATPLLGVISDTQFMPRPRRTLSAVSLEKQKIECGRDALHAAALQACGAAIAYLRSQVSRVFHFRSQKATLVLVQIAYTYFRSRPRRALSAVSLR